MRDPTTLIDALRSRMHEHASTGEFERAAECREQLAALVRACDARRHHDLVSGASTLVLERERTNRDGAASRTVTETVTLERGRLVSSMVDPTSGPEDGATQEALPDPAGRMDAPVGREEADLVRRWLASEGVRILHVDGVLASTVAGGRALARARDELRAAERSVRGDDVVLERRKVRRRRSDASTTG